MQLLCETQNVCNMLVTVVQRRDAVDLVFSMKCQKSKSQMNFSLQELDH